MAKQYAGMKIQSMAVQHGAFNRQKVLCRITTGGGGGDQRGGPLRIRTCDSRLPPLAATLARFRLDLLLLRGQRGTVGLLLHAKGAHEAHVEQHGLRVVAQVHQARDEEVSI